MFARINSIRQRLGEAFMGRGADIPERDLVKDGRISKKHTKSIKGSGKGNPSSLMFSKDQERQLLMAVPDKITTDGTGNADTWKHANKMEICDSIEIGTPSGKHFPIRTATSTPSSGQTKKSTPGAAANIARALTPESFGGTSDDEEASVNSEDSSPVEVETLERKEEATEEDHPHWSKAERDLFNKLNSRGYEPLLPKTWELDFPTMPLDLFSLDENKCFLKAIGGTDFKGAYTIKFYLPRS